MASFGNLKLPDISGAVGANADDAKKIKSYIYQLNEQLRYLMGNLDEENMSEDTQYDLGLAKKILAALSGLDGVDLTLESGGSQIADWDTLLEQLGQKVQSGGLGGTSGIKVESVSALPDDPDADTLYLIQGEVEVS